MIRILKLMLSVDTPFLFLIITSESPCESKLSHGASNAISSFAYFSHSNFIQNSKFKILISP